MIYRRQRQQYIFAAILAVIAIVNVLFFLILNRPAQTEYAALQESIRQLQAQIAVNTNMLANLQKTSTQLDLFDKDKNKLLNAHLMHRNNGYSEIVSALDSMVQHAGVNKTRVSYTLNPSQKAGLNTVAITIPLAGGYNNVVNFIRELENSETFFLITNIELATSEEAAAPVAGPQPVAVASNGGPVALSLGLETYFYQ
jgi:Tfp pilus assembly protein PilO